MSSYTKIIIVKGEGENLKNNDNFQDLDSGDGFTGV